MPKTTFIANCVSDQLVNLHKVIHDIRVEIMAGIYELDIKKNHEYAHSSYGQLGICLPSKMTCTFPAMMHGSYLRIREMTEEQFKHICSVYNINIAHSYKHYRRLDEYIVFWNGSSFITYHRKHPQPAIVKYVWDKLNMCGNKVSYNDMFDHAVETANRVMEDVESLLGIQQPRYII